MRIEGESQEIIERGLTFIQRSLEDYIDRMKLSANPVPVITVGGGSILFPDAINGVADIVQPEQAGVANAISVAIAQVSATIDRVFSLEKMSRTEAIHEATALAHERASTAGADTDRIEVLDLEEIPLAYLPGNEVRIKVKAVGSLKIE